MNKVSWPSRHELFRASVVVILVIFFLAALLFGYDVLLAWVMDGIGKVVKMVFGT
jgi:preprotein translocase subunit SecE